MRKIVLTKFRNFIACLDDNVILCTLSFRNLVTRYVGKKNDKRLEFRVVLLRCLLYFSRACLESGNLSLDGLSLLSSALLHKASDL